jgi:hypothetical protein
MTGQIRQGVRSHVPAHRVKRVSRKDAEREVSTFAILHAFEFCFFRADFSMWPLRLRAGKILVFWAAD